MGTGASAQAFEAVQSASATDVQATLELLSEADRAKLQEALAQAQGAAAGPAGPADGAEEAVAPAEAVVAAEVDSETKATKEEGPAEASGAAAAEAAAPAEAAASGEVAAPAEAAAPAEEPAQGEAAAEAGATEAGAGDAPFLAEYFDKAQARTTALLEDEEKLLALALDIEAQKKLKEESKQWFETEAKPLLEKSFKHHDTKNTGVLDKDEAAVFFAHMVQEETDMAKAMSALSIQAGMNMSLNMMAGLSEEQRAEQKEEIGKQVKKAIEAAKLEVQKKEDKYKADKAAHDVAAFKVLDTSGDGSVQLPEFIAAFEPETEMNINLHIALGYLTREEVDQQKRMEEQAKSDAKCASECNQQ